MDSRAGIMDPKYIPTIEKMLDDNQDTNYDNETLFSPDEDDRIIAKIRVGEKTMSVMLYATTMVKFKRPENDDSDDELFHEVIGAEELKLLKRLEDTEREFEDLKQAYDALQQQHKTGDAVRDPHVFGDVPEVVHSDAPPKETHGKDKGATPEVVHSDAPPKETHGKDKGATPEVVHSDAPPKETHGKDKGATPEVVHSDAPPKETHGKDKGATPKVVPSAALHTAEDNEAREKHEEQIPHSTELYDTIRNFEQEIQHLRESRNIVMNDARLEFSAIGTQQLSAHEEEAAKQRVRDEIKPKVYHLNLQLSAIDDQMANAKRQLTKEVHDESKKFTVRHGRLTEQLQAAVAKLKDLEARHKADMKMKSNYMPWADRLKWKLGIE